MGWSGDLEHSSEPWGLICKQGLSLSELHRWGDKAVDVQLLEETFQHRRPGQEMPALPTSPGPGCRFQRGAGFSQTWPRCRLPWDLNATVAMLPLLPC